jgi:hypothetical protein
MDSLITKYPVEIVTDEKVEETDCMLAAGEANLGRVESPASMLLTHIDTIRRLRELGVSGDFIITSGDFRITFPEK